MSINAATLAALADFPAQLAAHFSAFPVALRDWTPDSWEGVPSEPYSAIAQLCHVRDIEIDGYQLRFARVLREAFPYLPPVDGDALAISRGYAQADAATVLDEIRTARAQTLELLRSLDEVQLARTANFDGYGAVTLRALVHYLSSHDQQHLSGLQWLLGKIESQGIPSA